MDGEAVEYREECLLGLAEHDPVYRRATAQSDAGLRGAAVAAPKLDWNLGFMQWSENCRSRAHVSQCASTAIRRQYNCRSAQSARCHSMVGRS